MRLKKRECLFFDFRSVLHYIYRTSEAEETSGGHRFNLQNGPSPEATVNLKEIETTLSVVRVVGGVVAAKTGNRANPAARVKVS